MNRRGFILSATLTGLVRAADRGKLTFGCNQYPWHTFYQRDGKDWNKDLDASLADFVSTGIPAFEPLAASPAQIEKLAPLLTKHKLTMPSLYVNSKLHDKDAEQSIKDVLAIAEAAKKVGTHIIVTNPTPIRWGGAEDKSDEQLKTQAANLDRLGAELRKRDLVLAYHNHDGEMRRSAREFHHMMCGTLSKHVSLCLDAHWIYRGSGDSSVALFDIVKLYGTRVVEIHARQSEKGVWTEAFGPGDIDYAALTTALFKIGVRPHLVLEQAVEAKTPKTLTAAEAHRRGLKQATESFAGFVS